MRSIRQNARFTVRYETDVLALSVKVDVIRICLIDPYL